MELSCKEKSTSSNFAKKDPNIFRNVRVIDNLLKDEPKYVPTCDYFREVQTEIQPFMRNIVATWMMEVCEEQMCEEQIFPLAVNYMDRFLCACNIKRQQLQLLGATCLLLASKIRSSSYLPIDLLCAYTDYSVTRKQISGWEILVLSKLQWNVAGITGFDYVDQIIERFSWGAESDYLRRHAHTLVSICYTEPSLIQTPPSLIASACISAAMRGLRMPSTNIATIDMCNLLLIEPEKLEDLRHFVDRTIEKGMPEQQQQLSKSLITSSAEPMEFKDIAGYQSPNYGQPETPTEVENVEF